MGLVAVSLALALTLENALKLSAFSKTCYSYFDYIGDRNCLTVLCVLPQKSNSGILRRYYSFGAKH